jgi:hypothetical protein
VSELGNLTGGILLSPGRMSTVKIRARSLFRTPRSRSGAVIAGLRGRRKGFPHPSTAVDGAAQVVHKAVGFRLLQERPPWVQSQTTQFFSRKGFPKIDRHQDSL